MHAANHQTIKLSRGKHASAEEGACVMELASMLASEPFSDHPASVCPVIGAFLRAYNDSICDERRQDLYVYAAKVVGSRKSTTVLRARADRLAAWAQQMRDSRWTWRFVPARLRASSVVQRSSIAVMGIYAVRSLSRTDGAHASALALIDELLEVGAGESVGTGGGSCSLPAVSEAHTREANVTIRS
jgi:hypothetical protein